MAKKEKNIPMPMQLGSVNSCPRVCGILNTLSCQSSFHRPIIWAGLPLTYANCTSAIALQSFYFKNYVDKICHSGIF
ncbi:MAG: hypothetical protein ACLR1A_08120 [Eubacterium ventriosum]